MGTARLCLLGGFRLAVDGELLKIGRPSQRVVAYATIRSRPTPRLRLAAELWPDDTEARAGARLRSAIWRLGDVAPRLLALGGGTIALRDDVEADVRELRESLRVFASDAPGSSSIAALDTDWLDDELLPDWYDDWVLLERERMLQHRMHCLEHLSKALSAAGRHGEAIDAGMRAVHLDPLRESANEVLIEAYLAEGNLGLAVGQLRHYESVLRAELGLPSAPRLRARIAGASAFGDIVLAEQRELVHRRS